MNLEKVVVKRPVIIGFIISSFLVLTILVIYGLIGRETIITNWKMDVVGHENNIQSGVTTDIHLFLQDENGVPIKDANVKLYLDMPEMVHYIKKQMYHIEDGLYEAEVLLSMGGTWIGWVEAKKGNEKYINQFLIEADGYVVSQSHRDPNDHFHIDQPLPKWLTRQWEEID